MATRGVNKIGTDLCSIEKMLIDNSIDRVMAIDLDWNIVSWNRTSELMSGISSNKVIGKGLIDVFPEIENDQEMMDAIELAFAGKKTFLPSADSFNRQYYENHFIPLQDQNNNIIGVMNIMHDVAHRIKVEKQLQKLNSALETKYKQLEKANKELATFTYISSRDIREPLKHVYTSLEILIREEGAILSNMGKGNLRKMQSALTKINLLLDDITAISGISTENEPLSDVNLQNVLFEAKNNLRQKVREKKAVIESVALPVIKGYKNMIEYLFRHILDNGIKFQTENSIPRISINIQYMDEDFSEIDELIEGTEYLKISFTDNGIGFPAEDSERIFNLFEKLNGKTYHGSGVGLTICKKIMESHDGFIDAVSSPGNGAVISCYFPVDPNG